MSFGLEILPSCQGCGRCCEHMGTPPGYALGFTKDGPRLDLMWGDDAQHFMAMPDEVRQELAAYYATAFTVPGADRTAGDNTPCLWYDTESRMCKHHEWRPDICREFDPGSEGCINHREDSGRFLPCKPNQGLEQ